MIRRNHAPQECLPITFLALICAKVLRVGEIPKVKLLTCGLRTGSRLSTIDIATTSPKADSVLTAAPRCALYHKNAGSDYDLILEVGQHVRRSLTSMPVRPFAILSIAAVKAVYLECRSFVRLAFGFSERLPRPNRRCNAVVACPGCA
jgi:hypothetical protein